MTKGGSSWLQPQPAQWCFPKNAATSFLASAGYEAIRSPSDGRKRTASVPGLTRYVPQLLRLLWAEHAGTTYQSNAQSAVSGERASFTWPPVAPRLGPAWVGVRWQV